MPHLIRGSPRQLLVHMMKVEVLPCGAEIRDVDLGVMSKSDFQDVNELFCEHGLVFFRDQSIDETEHIRLAERWGEINTNRFFRAHEDYPQIAMVSKEPDQTVNIGGGWHTDHSYDFEPALGSILVARELPPGGGDTWFTSMYRAYDSLSDGLKKTLEGLNAVHSARHVFGRRNVDANEATSGRIGNAEAADELHDPVHPVVIRHPLSGRKALYVNPGFTLRFDGWSAEDSQALLQYLYQHASKEEFVTCFHWQPGSIAFWDNRATWHMAQNDYQGQRRVMHRITIEGCALERA
ncbi:MAG: TauD/TfdA family dioxygenase [bacterium]